MISQQTRLQRAQFKFKAINQAKNGDELSQIIQLNSVYTSKVLQDIVQETKGHWHAVLYPAPTTALQTGKIWNQITILHFRAAAELCNRNFAQAYTSQLECLQSFMQSFTHMDRWGLSTLQVLCKDLYQLAKQTKDKSKMEETVRAINQGFSMCMADKEPLVQRSRKWGTYRLANLLFVLYLRLRAYNLCTSMLGAIKASELPALERFPMADQATFRYYRGMLAFRHEQFDQARSDLMYALEHCYHDAPRNKTRILVPLIPIMMMDGVMPQPRLLQKYPQVGSLYGDICQAVRTGNIGKFDRLLQQKEQELIRMGTFLAMEHVRKIAVRQLLRRVYVMEGSQSRVPFARFQAGLRAAGLGDLDIAEVECMLADMIFAGYLKGYLAHDHGIAVLSKQQPFPCIQK